MFGVSSSAVVDASVLVSYLLSDDVHHLASVRWFDDWLLDDNHALVPAIAQPELAGAIARRSASPEVGIAAVAWLERQLDVIVYPVDASLSRDAARLAAILRHRGADAICASLARRLAVPLIT